MIRNDTSDIFPEMDESSLESKKKKQILLFICLIKSTKSTKSTKCVE